MSDFPCCERNEHDLRWSFKLNLVKPPAGLSANHRAHWRTKNTSTQLVRTQMLVLCRAASIPQLGRIRVDVEWVVKDRHHRDTDNLAPLLKAIYDGIGSNKGTSAHIVADDTPEFMEKPSATIRLEKGCVPHFMVTVTDLGGHR